MKKIQNVRSFYIALFCLLIPVLSYGQNKNQADEGDISQALLYEVRLLRQTLQNVNLYTYRGQIIIERIRAQRDRITRLTNTIESLRDEISNLEIQGPSIEEHLKELNERVDAESDSRQKTVLEDEIKSVKQALLMGKRREEELRKRESQLNTSLGQEQARLDNLERRLEQLENELESNIENQKLGSKKDQKKLP